MKQDNLDTFLGKHITVFGANRSGVAITRLLYNLDAKIILTDTCEREALADEISELEGLSVQFHFGGHDQACIDSAELIVVSPGVPLDIPILVDAKKKKIPIIGELEVSSQLCQAPIVAITGTKGKSTTTLLTAAVLESSQLFDNVIIAGNIGVPLASKVSILSNPDIAVVEASSFQLESTYTFHPVVSVILNIARDHLDRHGTMDAYYNAKLKICENQTESDWIVLNVNDSAAMTFSDATTAKKALFSDRIEKKKYHRDGLKDGIFVGLETVDEENYIYIHKGGEKHRICSVSDLPLAGSHNVRNTLAAVVVGSIYDVSIDTIRNAIMNFNPIHPALEHAFEKVDTINEVVYINDSKATNVIATYAALESIENTVKRRNDTKRVFLIIGGYDKGNDYLPLIDLVKKKVKSMILLGEYTQNIKKAFADCVNMYHVTTMDEAVEYAFRNALPGDIVLLSPANASFDMYENYKERGEQFKYRVKALWKKHRKSMSISDMENNS